VTAFSQGFLNRLETLRLRARRDGTGGTGGPTGVSGVVGVVTRLDRSVIASLSVSAVV